MPSWLAPLDTVAVKIPNDLESEILPASSDHEASNHELHGEDRDFVLRIRARGSAGRWLALHQQLVAYRQHYIIEDLCYSISQCKQGVRGTVHMVAIGRPRTVDRTGLYSRKIFELNPASS